MAISISALLAECGNAPWQSKGISVVVTQAFLGQKTAQSHSPMAPGKLTCLRQIFKRELLLFPQILWRFQIRVFCKLHPESTAFRSTVMAHQPFPSKPLHAWKPFQETCLYRDISFLGTTHAYEGTEVFSHLKAVQSTHSEQSEKMLLKFHLFSKGYERDPKVDHRVCFIPSCCKNYH